MDKCLMTKDVLERVLSERFGKQYEVVSITNLVGGAQKGSYKVSYKDGFECVLYIWDPSLSYFETNHNEMTFTSSSAELFQKNYECLTRHGVSVPTLYHIDLSKHQVPFAYALVQYIEGGELEPLLNEKKPATDKLLADLKENMRKLHRIKSDHVGDLKYTRSEDFSCKDYIKVSLDDNLKALIEDNGLLCQYKQQLLDVSKALYDKIEDRKVYTMIHFELGPNHVMIKEGKTYLIDFEGMKYFDLEYEYSFLKLRFGKAYEALVSEEVDEARMRFYLFYHHINALSGAYHLLKSGYDDLEDISEMITFNYRAITEDYLAV